MIPSLTATGITRDYGGFRALSGVDLALYPGSVVALLGINGAGKSTLMRILCGLDRPSSGEVSARSSLPLRRVVGYCPQELELWGDLGAHEQVAMLGQLHGLSRKGAALRAQELLEVLGLAARARELARELSSGMRRRLSIAMAMVHHPEVLILDEPEVGLDPQSRVSLRALIAQLAHEQERVVLLSTHNIDEVERVADRVVIMERGHVIARGEPAALVAALEADAVLTLTLPARTLHGELWEALTRGVPAERVHREHDRIVWRTSTPMAALKVWTQALEERALTPLSLSVSAATLEDVFLEKTGRRPGA